MRPRTLLLEGFRSHRDASEISFDHRSLLAVVGPIGAGKSTILDGICYALYAKTPRVKRSTKTLISSGSEQARLQLVFESDGVEYEVTRVINRAGRPGAHVFVDGKTGERTTGEAAVTKKVEEVLGLDFDGFRSSVLLAQNQFSRFLDADNSDRTGILKGVFRLDQVDEMRASAKDQRNEISRELAERSGELGSIPTDVEAQITSLQEEISTLEARRKKLEEAQAEEAKLEKGRAESNAALAAAKRAEEAAREALRAIPKSDVLTDISEREARAEQVQQQAGLALDEATRQIERAAEDLEGLERDTGTEQELRDSLKDVHAFRATSARFEAKEREVAALRSEEASAAEENADALQRERAADAACRAADEALQDAERRHMSHALRQNLAPGESCPVCEQVVATVPKGRAPASLEAARNEATAAKNSLEKAREASGRSSNRLAETSAAVATESKHLKELGQDVLKLHEDIKAYAGDRDPAEEIATRLERLQKAQDALKQAEKQASQARAAVESAREEAEQCASRRREVIVSLIRLAGSAGVEPPALEDRAPQVIAKAGVLTEMLGKMVEEAVVERARAAESLVETEDALLKLHSRAGVAEGETIGQALTTVASELGAGSSRLKSLRSDLKRRAKLLAQVDLLRARLGILEQLYKDLADTRFVSFLLQGRKRLLAELATARLLEMTNGRYRFTTDGEFNVVDGYAGDTERGSDSLSGGETFLASLALALGLADAVARHGGRLQCFFLDEGFGSLDPESFERALDGIEHLVSEDRLIALVSHLPALSERVDDKIELERDESGLTRLVAGARL